MKASFAPLLLSVVSLVGCNRGPGEIPVLDLNPSDCAQAAIEHYDGNKDGRLSREEVRGSAGILKAWSEIDADKDNSISHDELQSRVKYWVECPSRIVPLICRVNLDGRPLAGAQIRFIPEPFITPAVREGMGVTSAQGTTIPRVMDDDIADDLKELPGVRLGIYRVMVTHPDKKIPPKYNSNTTLGCEVVPGNSDFPMVFDLRSI
jgi:hypothetical protein